jgi:hypothetical protein
MRKCRRWAMISAMTTMSRHSEFDSFSDVKDSVLQLGQVLATLPSRDKMRACNKMIDFVLATEPDPETQRLALEWRRQHAS